MSAHPWMAVLLSLIAGGAAAALLAYLLLRWVALRIARGIALSTERRLADSIHHGMRRTGVLTPALDSALEAKYLRQIDKLAWLMDRMVPMPIVGGVGLDALFGLL